MAGPVPNEVLGLAVFVDVLSVIATVLGLLLCFMLWNHGERVSYILMLSASTTIGSAIGLVRHLDYTLNWRDIQIERFRNEQHHSYSQADMFGKADVGWRLVLSWISIFTYNVDALLVLFWSIALFIGTWDIKINASTKKTMSIVFKTSAVILPIAIGDLLDYWIFAGGNRAVEVPPEPKCFHPLFPQSNHHVHIVRRQNYVECGHNT
ncbi:hypothetical protein MPH_09805 [Macrophomina phaseolina MS6]|uniref:Uncharacterized protein n=1 Tax=Macrophomina phaseolina (strain MS6) TaxID=1126212 RepID=K2S886_MACPH|nr:hypothetical protein MPH_09805 [Macrophomina phaseolina MS6]